MIRFPILPLAQYNPPLRLTKYGEQDENGVIYIPSKVRKYWTWVCPITDKMTREIINIGE